MHKRLEQFINDEDLFSKDQLIMLAVSGGVDSVVLCHLLADLNYKCKILHCNFKLRGEESDEDELFVKNLANSLSFEFESISFETKTFAKKKKLSTQEAARNLRYDWFRKLHQENSTVVLTAHHLGDHFETYLMNTARGTGLKGLISIRSKRDEFRRPLLCFTKEEINKYAFDNQLEYREDSSNASDNYLRNSYRHKVVPLWKDLEPGIEQRNWVNSQLLSKQFENNKYLIAKHFKKAASKNYILEIPIPELLKFPHPDIALYELLVDYGFNATQCAQALDIKARSSGNQFSSEQYVLFRERDNLVVRIPEVINELSIDKPGSFQWGTCTLVIEEVEEQDVLFEKNIDRIFIDGDKISFPIMIRSWKNSDKMLVMGMKGEKLLSDLLIDGKVATWRKPLLPVFLSEGEIIWLGTIRQSELHKITSKTKSFLSIRLIE